MAKTIIRFESGDGTFAEFSSGMEPGGPVWLFTQDPPHSSKILMQLSNADAETLRDWLLLSVTPEEYKHA